ncbi:MAG: hypothetical protein ABEH43_08640 [Flavobacteriales bacterium]
MNQYLPFVLIAIFLFSGCNNYRQFNKSKEEREKIVNELVNSGDEAFHKTDYKLAKKRYDSALSYMEREYLREQIVKINKSELVKQIELTNKRIITNKRENKIDTLKDLKYEAKENKDFKTLEKVLLKLDSLDADIHKKQEDRREILSYKKEKFLNKIPSYTDKNLKKYLNNNQVKFMCGFTYYIPAIKGHETVDGEALTWGKINVLKGDIGIVNEIHERAVAKPNKTLKVNLHRKPIPNQFHTYESIRRSLVDSTYIATHDTTVPDSTERMSGLSFQHELYYDINRSKLNSRLNYIAPLKSIEKDNHIVGYHPIYAFPYNCEYNHCKNNNKEHPFNKNSIQWGLKLNNKVAIKGEYHESHPFFPEGNYIYCQ